MKIEDEIYQKKFRNNEEKLAVNLIYTNNWLKEFHIKLFKPYDITIQQYNILRILRGSAPEPLTLKKIKERMLDKMSDVSRLIDRLEKKKLVRCAANYHDRRNLDVGISKKGLKLLTDIDDISQSVDLIFKELTESEIAQMNNMLDRIRSYK
jgi:DNA-binding MarR family transcriptional regulator